MNFKIFFYFCGHFCPPGSGSGFGFRIRNPALSGGGGLAPVRGVGAQGVRGKGAALQRRGGEAVAPEALPPSTATNAPSGKLKGGGGDTVLVLVLLVRNLCQNRSGYEINVLHSWFVTSDDSKSLEFLSNSRNLTGTMKTNPNSKMFAFFCWTTYHDRPVYLFKQLLL